MGQIGWGVVESNCSELEDGPCPLRSSLFAFVPILTLATVGPVLLAGAAQQRQCDLLLVDSSLMISIQDHIC